MARTVVKIGKDLLFFESIKGITRVYKMDAHEFRKKISERDRSRILVGLFMNDTDHRKIADVAKDLGIEEQRAKMMRYQFRDMDDWGDIRGKRRNLLQAFYKV